jgi:hypothetical protein
MMLRKLEDVCNTLEAADASRRSGKE